jgi:uncharacterized membrane protein YeiH
VLQTVLDLLGTAVFAVSGALAAGRKQLDLLGVLVLALVTAVGGGTIRDVLLDRHPIFWLADPRYVLVIVAAALFTVAWTRRWSAPESALLIADAIGLGAYAIVGAQVVERAGCPAASGILLGAVTGGPGGPCATCSAPRSPTCCGAATSTRARALAGAGPTSHSSASEGRRRHGGARLARP